MCQFRFALPMINTRYVICLVATLNHICQKRLLRFVCSTNREVTCRNEVDYGVQLLLRTGKVRSLEVVFLVNHEFWRETTVVCYSNILCEKLLYHFIIKTSSTSTNKHYNHANKHLVSQFPISATSI